MALSRLLMLLVLILALLCVACSQESIQTQTEAAEAPGTCMDAAAFDEAKAAWEAKVAEGLQLAKELGAEVASARETIVDLKRTVERKKNDVITSESLLKNCALDKTVATESVGKYKAKIAKLELEVETLRSQVKNAGKSTAAAVAAVKCPAYPACAKCPEAACPKAPKAKACPPCGPCQPGESRPADTCPLPFWSATNTSGVSAQHCAAFFVQESSRAAAQAGNWTLATAKVAHGHWLSTGLPACLALLNATKAAVLSGNRAVLQPFYEQHVLPPWNQHAQPHVDEAVAWARVFYAENLAEPVNAHVLPWAEFLWGKAHVAAYYAYHWLDWLDFEELPLNAWLLFARSVRAAQDGAQFLIDALEGNAALRGLVGEGALKTLAPMLVHGSGLTVLFLLRRVVFSLCSLFLFVLLSPVLLLVWLLTLPFRRRKGASSRRRGAGPWGAFASALGFGRRVGPSPVPGRANANLSSSLPPPPVYVGGPAGLGEAAWEDSAALSSRAAMDVLRDSAPLYDERRA